MIPDDNVSLYYSRGKEKDRLNDKANPNIELIRTLDIIQRFIPGSPAIIVDIGGGAGIYAFHFADKGYEVHLIDLIQLHIDQALTENSRRKKKLASITQGDARAVKMQSNVADVVLLLGPLYHLTAFEDRLKTIQEAYRILKPGGLLFSAGISKFASLFDGFERNFILDPKFTKIVEGDLKSGQHRNPDNLAGYFTTAFFHHPEELKKEHLKAGFKQVEVFSVEGPLSLLGNSNEYLNSNLDLFLEYSRKIEKEPSLLGASSHILAKCKK